MNYEKILDINKNTMAYVAYYGKLKRIKDIDKINEICANLIKGYKEKDEKYIIICIQKDDFLFFINSHFKNKRALKKARKNLEKKGYKVLIYNG